MGPQDPRLSSPAERERSAAKDKGTGGQYVAVCSVSNSPLTHNPFVTLSQPFRIKCERYIFLKKCVRSSLLLILFPHVYVLRLCNSMSSCILSFLLVEYFLVILECPVLSVLVDPTSVSFSSSFFRQYFLLYLLEFYCLSCLLCCFSLFIKTYSNLFSSS